jgi:hypothetical protein
MKIVPASRIGSADRLAKLSRSRETEKSPTSSGGTGSKGWHKAREPDTIIRRWMVHHELHVRQDFKSSIALLDCEFGTAVEPVHLNALTGCETIALKADPIDVRPQLLGIQAAKHAIVLVRCRARHKSDGRRRQDRQAKHPHAPYAILIGIGRAVNVRQRGAGRRSAHRLPAAFGGLDRTARRRFRAFQRDLGLLQRGDLRLD